MRIRALRIWAVGGPLQRITHAVAGGWPARCCAGIAPRQSCIRNALKTSSAPQRCALFGVIRLDENPADAASSIAATWRLKAPPAEYSHCAGAGVSLAYLRLSAAHSCSGMPGWSAILAIQYRSPSGIRRPSSAVAGNPVAWDMGSATALSIAFSGHKPALENPPPGLAHSSRIRTRTSPIPAATGQ